MTRERGFDRWTYHFPYLSEEQAAEIARVIVAWSFLEEHVSVAIGISLAMDADQSMAFTNAMRSFRSRIEALYGLWDQTDRNITERELKPLCKEINRLYAVRNALAHRPWWTTRSDELYSYKLDPDNMPFHPAEQWTVSNLKKAIADIEEAIERLQNFIDDNRPIMEKSRARFSPGHNPSGDEHG